MFELEPVADVREILDAMGWSCDVYRHRWNRNQSHLTMPLCHRQNRWECGEKKYSTCCNCQCHIDAGGLGKPVEGE